MIERKPVLPAIWLSLIHHVSKSWVFWIFWINVLVFIYKGICLPYTKSEFGLEVTLYVVWGLTSVLRYSVGSHGLSRCEPLALIFYVLLTLFTMLCGSLYFVHYQVFVLRMELIFNAFCFALQGVETILALVCAIMYSKQQAI
jgi:hypothetical protein